MSNDIQFIIFIVLVVAIVIFLIWFFIFKVKHLKLPNVYLVTGGVKTGKSFVSVALAIKHYKRNIRRYYIGNFFIKVLINPILKLFRKPTKKYLEKPMLYSNMHLRRIKYNLLTIEIIERKVRIPTNSVVLIDEVSLFADSMLVMTKFYKEQLIHEKLMLFIKLFGHSVGGRAMLIVNTQSLGDCAFEIKRCISSYLWIQNKRKFPFFSLLQVRELAYAEDTNIVNNFDKDSEVDNRPLFILNKYMKYYDYRCYSIFTDKLQLQVNYDHPIRFKHDSCKTDVLLSLQEFKTLSEFKMKYESEVSQNEKK